VVCGVVVCGCVFGLLFSHCANGGFYVRIFYWNMILRLVFGYKVCVFDRCW